MVVKQYGEGYRSNRLHSVAVLKQFGFGDKRRMEAIIHSEAEHLMEHMRAQNGIAVDPADSLMLSILNVIYQLLFGKRFEANDPPEVYIRETIKQFAVSADPVYEVFPIVAHLPRYKKKLADMLPVSKKLMRFLRDKIRDCVESDADENFVAEYVKRVGQNFDETELRFILRDFVMGGTETTETTSTQMTWAMILLANHPEVQTSVQSELDSVVSRNRLASMDDKAMLPYFEAVTLEIMRYRPIAPLALPRVTLCDTEAVGYSIPDGTMVSVRRRVAMVCSIVW